MKIKNSINSTTPRTETKWIIVTLSEDLRWSDGAPGHFRSTQKTTDTQQYTHRTICGLCNSLTMLRVIQKSSFSTVSHWIHERCIRHCSEWFVHLLLQEDIRNIKLPQFLTVVCVWVRHVWWKTHSNSCSCDLSVQCCHKPGLEVFGWSEERRKYTKWKFLFDWCLSTESAYVPLVLNASFFLLLINEDREWPLNYCNRYQWDTSNCVFRRALPISIDHRNLLSAQFSITQQHCIPETVRL